MTPARTRDESLRPGNLEISRLAWALGISLAFHLLLYGGYQAGRKFHLSRWLELPAWLRDTKILAALPKQDQPLDREVPLVFVDVNPNQATAEAPKNAEYYSDKNSQAANPDADKDTGNPKINGTQTQIAKAEDTPRSPFDKLQPDFHSLDQQRQVEKSPPSTAQPPGDLAMARPDSKLRPDNGNVDEPRPRTVLEALARQNRTQLVGEKMKQDGGVSRFRLDPGFDVKATPFGAYDAMFIRAVQDHWYDLLDNISYEGYRSGKVVVQFHLNPDGTITDVKVLQNNVGEMLGLLCQKAVIDPAPYEKWPRDMRLMVDKDYREIQFTFYYN